MHSACRAVFVAKGARTFRTASLRLKIVYDVLMYTTFKDVPLKT
jgi:hypothetical protein